MSFYGKSHKHCRWPSTHGNTLCSVCYVSPASTARHLYLRGGVGVGSMIKVYGGRQRNGVCPAHFSVGSRNVARKVLQALEGLKMVEKDPNGWERLHCVFNHVVVIEISDGFFYFLFYQPCAYSGRRLTPQGQRDLDRIAGQVGCWTLNTLDLILLFQNLLRATLSRFCSFNF